MSTNRFEVAIKIDEISVQTTRGSVNTHQHDLSKTSQDQSAYISPTKHPVVLGLLDVEAGSSHL